MPKSKESNLDDRVIAEYRAGRFANAKKLLREAVVAMTGEDEEITDDALASWVAMNS